MPKTKQNNKQGSRSGVNQAKNKKLSFLLVSKRKPLLSLLVILAISVVGASVLVFSQAAPNNCQKQDGVPICDVDQVASSTDTILSRGSEPKDLGSRGWGVYYGTVFRAPAHAYKKAVPITRVHNAEATYHDWVTPKQKSTKEAKYKGKVKSGGVAFYAWTKDTRPGGTVPVYRLTRAGNHTQPIFSTDGAWVLRVLAQDKGKANGWKKDDLAPYVAFYAYKPNYQVVNKEGDKTVTTPNPYDCSIEANFISDRCKIQRENLEKTINQQQTEQQKQETAKTQQEQIKKHQDAAKQTTTAPSSSANDKIGNDACPTAAGDAGLNQYKNGVNNQGKKYPKSCHEKWIGYAMNKNKPSTNSKPIQTAVAISGSDGVIGNDACPTASGDAGMNQYKNGVNNQGKKYPADCHKFWLAYASSKQRINNAFRNVRDVASQSIKGCPVWKPTAHANDVYYVQNKARLDREMVANGQKDCAFFYAQRGNDLLEALQQKMNAHNNTVQAQQRWLANATLQAKSDQLRKTVRVGKCQLLRAGENNGFTPGWSFDKRISKGHCNIAYFSVAARSRWLYIKWTFQDIISKSDYMRDIPTISVYTFDPPNKIKRIHRIRNE